MTSTSQKFSFESAKLWCIFFINKTIDVLIENELEGQNKLFGRNQYMNSVIFEGNKNLIGKNINIKIERVNQKSLFGKVEKNNKIGVLVQ